MSSSLTDGINVLPASGRQPPRPWSTSALPRLFLIYHEVAGSSLTSNQKSCSAQGTPRSVPEATTSLFWGDSDAHTHPCLTPSPSSTPSPPSGGDEGSGGARTRDGAIRRPPPRGALWTPRLYGR